MFGFSIPPDMFKNMGKAKEKTIDDVVIGSFWKDEKDDSIWRVSHKDDKVHVVSSGGPDVRVYGVNMFFATFSLVEFGAVCVSCKNKFEYSEKRPGFECWACKNGA